MARQRAAAQLPALLALVLACLLTVASGAAAQAPLPMSSQGGQGTGADAPKIPESLTRQDVRDLVSRLSDEDVRAVLIRQLDKAALADAPEDVSVQQRIQALLPEARDRLIGGVTATPRLPEIGAIVIDRVSDGRGLDTFLVILAYAVGIFAVAGLVEVGFRRLFSQFGTGPGPGALSVLDRLCILGMRLGRDVLAIAVFATVATALFFALQSGSEAVRVLMSNAFWGIIVFRLIAAALRFGLAPHAPWLRVPDLTDRHARIVYDRLRLAVGTVVVVYCVAQILGAYVADAGLRLLIAVVAIVLVLVVLVGIVWRDRRAVGQAILGEPDDGAGGSRVRSVLASNWHLFVTGLLALMGLIAIGQLIIVGEPVGAPIIASLVILLMIPVLDWGVRAMVSRLLKLPGPIAGSAPGEPVVVAPAAGEPPQAAQATRDAAELTPEPVAAAEAGHPTVPAAIVADRRPYYDVLIRNLRIVIAVFAIAALADVWDFSLQAAAERGVGTTLAGAMFDIIITLILASAAWGIIRVAIRSAVPEAEGDQEEAEAGEIGGKGKSRLETLIPLLGNVLIIALIVVVVLIILSELGIDIGPLIAGAGVVGLAIGFGAQTLVRDVISGLFFLIDDAFRVGEYVDIGAVRGMVEHISIRSLRLRHHNGPLHTVPFGEIQHLTNYSRDWAIMKLEVRVPFDTDLEKVRKLIKKTGQEMMNDPVHGPNFLQPVKSQGVHRMDDSAFIIRVKFMAKPGEQFVLRREVFRRVQEAFAANGIRFAPRRVIVDTGGQPMSPAAAAAAAAESADATEKGPGDHDQQL